MIFYLDSNEVKLELEAKGIRLTTNSENNILLANVTMNETKEIIIKNYNIVKEHYQPKINDKISSVDLERISLKIVLHYFYMYQLWRAIYRREKNRDLKFLHKDFNHPYTSDEIISYFKGAYPKNYSSKCEIMLDMSTNKFKDYEKNRQAFYDMR